MTEREQRRMRLELERVKKQQADVQALLEARRTAWYRAWERRVDHNKYTPDGRKRRERV